MEDKSIPREGGVSQGARVSGRVQRAIDPYSRCSNQCYPFGKRPAGAKFISDLELYNSLQAYSLKTNSASRLGRHLLVHIAIFPIVLLYFLVFLPGVMCFRDSLLGGLYILASLGSYYQLQGKERTVFISVLAAFFYWWCISRALWGPNKEILNTLEALNYRRLIKLLKRLSIKRGNPFTGLVVRTNYINTIKPSVGFNCSKRWNVYMTDTNLIGADFNTPKSTFMFPNLRVEILYVIDDPKHAAKLEDTYGMISIQCGDDVLTDYNSYHVFQKIYGYFKFLSFNPDNLTCSETIGSEMGIPCAYAISMREVMDHFARDDGLYQMKFDNVILVK